MRAEYLIAVAEGLLSIHDVVAEALDKKSKALCVITLRQLLLSQPGWGRKRAEDVLRRLSEVVANDTGQGTPTIAWLLDARTARSRRVLAWIDAVHRPADLLPNCFPFEAMD